jgi:thiamine-monophosphate kinase
VLETPLGPGPEFDRIRSISQALGEIAVGLGGDCALVEMGGRTLALSIDASIEGVHFRRAWLTPAEIGWRAAAAALSDLAAIGAEPCGVLAALTVPRTEPPEVSVELMRGVGAVCRSVGARVLGGDLNAADALAVTLTVLGWVDRPIGRRGARPGDAIWVTGALGGARAALAAWHRALEPDPAARAAFARPEPRVAAGRWLAALGAGAMIDLSDGLAGDAGHLAAAGEVDLELDLDRLPLGPGVEAAAAREGEDPRLFAAAGGEDYELLATLPAECDPARPPASLGPAPLALTRIGTVGSGEGTVRLLRAGRPVRLQGFDHFA